MTNPNLALQAVSEHMSMLTASVKHLTAENAGLVRVYEVAMQLVSSQGDWTPAQREQLASAVKACNNVPGTAKAIREIESDGIDLLRQEMEKLVNDGVSDLYRPGIDSCLGMAEALAYQHRLKAR